MRDVAGREYYRLEVSEADGGALRLTLTGRAGRSVFRESHTLLRIGGKLRPAIEFIGPQYK